MLPPAPGVIIIYMETGRGGGDRANVSGVLTHGTYPLKTLNARPRVLESPPPEFAFFISPSFIFENILKLLYVI